MLLQESFRVAFFLVVFFEVFLRVVVFLPDDLAVAFRVVTFLPDGFFDAVSPVEALPSSIPRVAASPAPVFPPMAVISTSVNHCR
jgi:hypothetical protein